ncbi:Hypothetical predicted protein [Paramuricea clavata]|uniref:Uncharacterized protein n=1 Tax=Paramuricea clavata TaxID=317549 RepID=A0A6S7GCM2_PARCT|nr:Hypothetical predicted protein [Paramuricea clavata]
MDDLKQILRTALSTVDEITSTNTPERTGESQKTWPTGSEVNNVSGGGTPQTTRTSPLVSLVGSTPRRQSLLTSSPTLPAAFPVAVAQAEANFRYHKTPSIKEASNLLYGGLGKRRITFSNKQGDFNHLKTTLEKEYPKLSCQNGPFELLRADRGGATRPLIPIPMAPSGYGIPYLKNAVSDHAIIYVRPIQSELEPRSTQ